MLVPAIATQESPQRVPLAPRKVLLVNEDRIELRYYAGVLQQHGYDVRSCTSYAEGVRCLESEHFDFVLVDQGSPGFEGRSVLERASAIDRHTPMLVVTRCLDMNCYLEAMQLGAFDYVEKPLSASDIARLVDVPLNAPRMMAASTRSVGTA